METFFWVCGALIVIGLPALAILMIYASLQSVKEYVVTIESLKTDIYNHESAYEKLEIEKDGVEIKLKHAIQGKEYIEKKWERFNSEHGYKHTEVANSIHYGILKKLYKYDDLYYVSLLFKEHGGSVADFNQEEKDQIIEKFIRKHPKPTIR